MIIDSWANSTFASSSFHGAPIYKIKGFTQTPLLVTIRPSYQWKEKSDKTDPAPPSSRIRI